MRFVDPNTPEGQAKVRQDAADDAHSTLNARNHGVECFPTFLAECIERRVWEGERTLASGKKLEPVSFKDFVHEHYPVGLGSTFAKIEAIIAGNAQLVALWEQESGRKLSAQEFLPLASIRLDGGTQSRACVDDAVVAEYAEHLSELPPVVVFYDGSDYWLADGFHRVAAHARAGSERVLADVRQGHRRDAILHSVGANASHGLRRTNADKRRAVELLLRDEEWTKRSDRWIAEKCGVSHPFVAGLRVKPELEMVSSSQLETRAGQDGKARKLPVAKPSNPKPTPASHGPTTTHVEPAEPPAPGHDQSLVVREELNGIAPPQQARADPCPRRTAEARTLELFEPEPDAIQHQVSDEQVDAVVAAFERLSRAQRAEFFRRVNSLRT